MERYSAKLLFQFRVVRDGNANRRRVCEERIIVLTANSAREALTQAKKSGKDAQFRHENPDGSIVHFEFIGVQDLQHLGAECEPDEVWYDLRDRVSPMERRKDLIPPESELNAIVWEKSGRAPARKSRRR